MILLATTSVPMAALVAPALRLTKITRNSITPEARHRVTLTQAKNQALRHLLKQQITHIVSQRIVQVLEMVKVNEQQSAVVLASIRGRHRLS